MAVQLVASRVASRVGQRVASWVVLRVAWWVAGKVYQRAVAWGER